MLHDRKPVKGAGLPFTTLRSDKRVGRIDFQIRNTGTESVKIQCQETTLDKIEAAYNASGVSNLGSAQTVTSGGTITISVSSGKSVVRLISASDNTGSSSVHVNIQFLGQALYGNLTLVETMPLTSAQVTAYTGTNLTGSGIDL